MTRVRRERERERERAYLKHWDLTARALGRDLERRPGRACYAVVHEVRLGVHQRHADSFALAVEIKVRQDGLGGGEDAVATRKKEGGGGG